MNSQWIWAGIAALAIGLAGCASTPVERKEQTAESLSDTKHEMAAVRARIDDTLASLEQLVNASPPDLQKAYARYARNVDGMRAEAQAMERRANDLRRRGTEYLTGWQRTQREVQDPQLRALSQERREQVAGNLADVNASFLAVRDAFSPFLTDLEDVRKVIGNDLTATGVSTVRNTEVVRNAYAHGVEVANQLDTAIAEFDELARSLAPPAPK
jgi:hypothetical protein